MTQSKLQVALDFLELSRAMKAAEAAVAGGADYIEAGTPLIKSEGLDAIRKLRRKFPDKTIVADMKTMDVGRIEAESAAKAGANVMTVCAAAGESTIAECVQAARHYGIEVAVDMMGSENPAQAAQKLQQLGVARLDVHCPIDQQMHGGDPLETLREIRSATDLIIAVAGGINSQTAPVAVKAGADIVIVGGAITKAVDPAQATAEIKKAMDTGKAGASENFKRASDETIRQILQKVSTSNISDGAHRQECLAGMNQIVPGSFACGPALTVRTLPGDWAKPVEAIDAAEEGDIIVVDACGREPAIWGELASHSAVNKKISALVVYGAVRDTAEIRKLGFPVWSLLVTSHAGDPHGLGEINVPIVISGQRICPGDWIVADDDGVMVLPKSRAVEMVNRAANVLEAENRIRREIHDGKSTLAEVVNLTRWEKEGPSNAIVE